MNTDLKNTQFYFVGHVVDYEIFATIQPICTPTDILDILLRLNGAEQEGRDLHEFHARSRCRENFSQRSPGATLWKRKSSEPSHAESIMDFSCEEIDVNLAETIHRICMGKPSSPNTSTTLSSM